jgi:N-acetylmuramoyl-L-alanine amidase
MKLSDIDYLYKIDATLRERELLGRLIYCEARGESDIGKKAIVYVVINRMYSNNRYGNSISEVILRPQQFCPLNRENLNFKYMKNPPADNIMMNCRKITDEILKYYMVNDDPTEGATHFHSIYIHPSWAESVFMKKIKTIGKHIFYKEEL